MLQYNHKYLPVWMPPAGHIEPDQTPVEALYVEIKEEAGIDPANLEIVQASPHPPNFQRDDASELPLPFDMEHHAITDTH